MKCRECGKNIENSTKFCKYCGTPVESLQMMEPKDIKKCDKCGAIVKEGNAFCTKCGSPLSSNGIDEEESDDEQEKGGFPIFIVFLLLITLLLLGCLIYWFPVRNYFSKKVEAEQSPHENVQVNQNEPEKGENQKEDKETSYIIQCKDLDGIILSSEEKKGVVGEEVTVNSPNIDGYTTQSNTKTVILKENSSDNTIVFTFAPNETVQMENTMVEYSIVCIDEISGTVLLNKTYYGESGTEITVSSPEVEGYAPKQDEMSITLSDDASENIMYFVYSEGGEIIDTQDSDTDIPTGNVLVYGGHTYYAYRTSSIGSYQQAQDYCDSRGGYLATIDDDYENTALYEYVMYDRGFDSAYFGLTDEGSEGDWYWVNGADVQYTNWLSGQPDNHGGSENYALFYNKDKAYKWNDGDFGPDSAGTVTFLIEWDYVQ